MKLYNFNRYSGGKRLVRGTLYTLPIALLLSIVIGIIQNSIRLQLSLSYLLIAYVISSVFRKYGRSVSIQASYIAIAIFVVSILTIDLFTIIGLNIPSIQLLSIFTPVIIISALNITDLSSIINLLIIIYSINIVYKNSRII
ncbi:MAG: hypothetical protein KGZ84_08610 [Erysipelotrichia bacterium]|nr:hypothetical protein [Erysipelotrichia bacterium]